MKRLLFSLVLVTLLNPVIYSQWYQQNSGTSSNLFFIQFLNNDTGWIIGPVLQEGFKLYKTTNGGTDWVDKGIILLSGEGGVTTFYFLNDSVGWFTTSNIYNEISSIYKTTDGGENWYIQSTNYSYTSFFEIQFLDTLVGYVAGYGQLGTGFVYKTTDGGNNWVNTFGSGTSIGTSSLSFLNKDTGWVSGTNILKTTDGGTTWQEQLNIEPYSLNSIQFVNEQTGWASYGDYYNPNVVYKTTNGGNSWFQQSTIDQTSTFYTDTLNGWLINGSDIFHTTDGGDNWILQNSNTSEELYDIFFIDNSQGWAIGVNGTILHTINGGTPVELVSFNAVSYGNDVELNWETVTESNNRGFEVEILQDYRIAELQDWETIGFVEGNGTTTDRHSYRFTDNDVSPGNYLYRLKQFDYDGSFEYSNEVEVNVNSPLAFSLGQNYPNPFNPATTISYQLAVNGLVTLKVYNSLGEEVVTLVNEEKSAGAHKVEFDGSDLPSGLYIYRLTAGRNTAARKLVLIK